jgi:3-isopropylmalate/(R)-2-methylmalate dehydratase small subunit
LTGKAWIFGDDINTDVMASGIYMKGSLDELASHCLETIEPDFANNITLGDVLVAGENLGIGSSREQAVEVLKHLGVRALVAKSFAGIFYRNALNFGLVAVTCADVDKIQFGDQIEVDAVHGKITNHSCNRSYPCDALPGALLTMVLNGGLVAHLKKTRVQNLEKDASV